MNIIHIIISIALYFILVLLSTNLLGFLIRGLFTNPEFEKLKSEGSEFIKQEIEKSQRYDKWTNVIAFLLIVFYLYATFHFWNIGVTTVAIVLMMTRLPDLLWEIKTGKKITVGVAISMPKNALYFITTFLDWAALPVALYYFLYHF
jgi:hypothetical protein